MDRKIAVGGHILLEGTIVVRYDGLGHISSCGGRTSASGLVWLGWRLRIRGRQHYQVYWEVRRVQEFGGLDGVYRIAHDSPYVKLLTFVVCETLMTI